MNEQDSKFPESNPFSTRFTAPGKTPFFFERSFANRIKAMHPAKFEEFFVRALGKGEDIRQSICLQYLVDQFETHFCRGQIVGSHGSGKTTLLLALKEALLNKGYEIFSWTLHDNQSFLSDQFWTELRDFLRAIPDFLPAKCLLPPPVISREEYLAQQRERFREDFMSPGASVDAAGAPLEEFNVSEEVFAASSDGGASSTPSDSSRADGKFLGFNENGNFGLNRPRADGSGSSSTFEPLDGSDPVEFAPFPGIAMANENVSSAEEEPYDEVRLDETAVDLNTDPGQAIAQFPTDADVPRRRSFFDRKVVLFDGFEQLSYFNRIVLRTFCRMNRLGLLVTSHVPVIGMPALYRAAPSVETLGLLLDYLLDDAFSVPEPEQLEIILANYHYDVRKILFSFYDRCERARLVPRETNEKIVRVFPR